MDVHKLLIGEGAGTYLPFALSRLARLERINKTGYFSQTFVIDDAKINVRQVGKHKYITITVGGGFYFEFVSSGNPVVVGVTEQQGVSYNSYNGVVVSTEVIASNGTILTKPVIREQRRMRSELVENFSEIEYPIQIQLYNESPRYKQLIRSQRDQYLYPNVVLSTSAPFHSFTGLSARAPVLRHATFTFATSPGTAECFNLRDVGYDVRWGYSEKRAVQTEALIIGDADWPRASGHQTVVDPDWGTRTFAVQIDAIGQVQVWPVAAIQPLTTFAQNVQDDHVRRFAPTMPSWCYLPTAKFLDEWLVKSQDQMLIDQPEINWEFNHTGTRAAAVIVARSVFENDPAYFALYATTDQPWTQTKFDDILIPLMFTNAIHYRGGFTATGYNDTTRYFFGAGIVELQINITLTGTDLNEYTAEVVVVEVRDPNTSTYSAAFAGYSWIDIPAKGIAAGDMLAVDFEGYGQASETPADPSYQYMMSVKNVTQNTEVMCIKAQPILGVDLTTCSFALKLRHLDRRVGPITTPTRDSYTGDPYVDIYWLVEKWGVWIIHSAAHKGIIYPETMSNEYRAEVDALATLDGRAYMDALIAGDPRWEYVPLVTPEDGWADAACNLWREYWSYDTHYWYNEPWVIWDADWVDHGTNYPDQGYLRYRDAPGGYTSPDLSYTPYRMHGLYRPPNMTNEHLNFCNNPRWGWYYYAGLIKHFLYVSAWTTFFTHPNGSYTFWCDQLIYNSQGVPTLGSDSPTSYEASLVNSLAVFDVTKLEHCIIDRVHLEVRKKVGVSAQLDTTFRELYNRAVVAGKAAETLEENINEIALVDMQGVFEKETDTTYDIYPADKAEILDLKFTWNTRIYYWAEPAIRGNYVPVSTEPYPAAFSPEICGGLIGLSLGNFWSLDPNALNTDRYNPSFVDDHNPTALPFRFTNPLILTG